MTFGVPDIIPDDAKQQVDQYMLMVSRVDQMGAKLSELKSQSLDLQDAISREALARQPNMAAIEALGGKTGQLSPSKPCLPRK